MLRSRPATFIALAFIGLALTLTPSSLAQESGEKQSAEWAAQHAPPRSCSVTLPSDASFIPPYPVPTSSAAHFGLAAKGKFGTEKLWTVIPLDGIWRGPVPREPGDFAYGDKLPWFRVHPAFSLNDGALTITGKRLDGPAPSFIETFVGGGLPLDAYCIGRDLADPGGQFLPGFGISSSGASLVRPDGFVAWRCSDHATEPAAVLHAALGASLKDSLTPGAQGK